MDMGQGVALAVTEEQWQAVEGQLRRRDLPPRVRERLEMVKAAVLRQDRGAIAAWSGRSERTVRRWLRRFVAGGVAALGDAPRSGRPAQADAAYLAALDAAVGTAPPALGLPFDVWTSARLVAYLEQGTGVRIAPGWLRVLLARRDYACGRPKHTLAHLQDPAEVAACQAALAAAKKRSPVISRTGSCTTRMRRTWRPILSSPASGTARASSRPCRRPAPIGG